MDRLHWPGAGQGQTSAMTSSLCTQPPHFIPFSFWLFFTLVSPQTALIPSLPHFRFPSHPRTTRKSHAVPRCSTLQPIRNPASPEAVMGGRQRCPYAFWWPHCDGGPPLAVVLVTSCDSLEKGRVMSPLPICLCPLSCVGTPVFHPTLPSCHPSFNITQRYQVVVLHSTFA